MAVLGDLEIDVLDTDQPNYSNTVTQKPVEDGADISDHIKHDPIEFNLKCYFAGDEALDKHDQLLEMRNQEEVFAYEGSFGIYENMAIVEIMPLKNAKHGNGFECDITLRQVRFVEAETVMIILGEDPVTSNQVQGESEETEQKSEKSEEKDEETIDSTTLKNLFDKIGEFLGGDEG